MAILIYLVDHDYLFSFSSRFNYLYACGTHYPKIELEFRHFKRFGQMAFVGNLNLKVSSYLLVIKYSKRFNYTLFKYIVTETTNVSLIF